MEPKYIFTVLKETGDIEDKITAFALPDSAKGSEETFLRTAVRRFLHTKLGEQSVIDTKRTFNWRDAACYIPQSFWAEYSIFPIYSNGSGPYNMGNFQFKDFTVVTVPANEILCD